MIMTLEEAKELIFTLIEQKNFDTEELISALKKIPKIENIFSEGELYEESNFFYPFLLISYPKKITEKKEKISNAVNYLISKKEYLGIILLDTIRDLPIGIKIGKLEIIQENRSETHLREHLEYMEKKEGIKLKGCSWAQIKFTSNRIYGVKNDLYNELSVPYSVLSLLLLIDLDVAASIGAIYHPNGRIEFLRPFKPIGITSFPNVYMSQLQILSEITTKQNPTKLEKKIIQALQIYNLSKISKKTEIRFLLTIAAFESLLLTNNDRDYLGKKLSEKTAFLLADTYENRIELYRLMKKYYELRSTVIHGGSTVIEKFDERTVKEIFEDLIFKIIELTKKYDKMEQKDYTKPNDKEGLEDLINQKKFS